MLSEGLIAFLFICSKMAPSFWSPIFLWLYLHASTINCTDVDLTDCTSFEKKALDVMINFAEGLASLTAKFNSLEDKIKQMGDDINRTRRSEREIGALQTEVKHIGDQIKTGTCQHGVPALDTRLSSLEQNMFDVQDSLTILQSAVVCTTVHLPAIRCGNNDDCPTPNSVCRSWKCQCDIGYSYNPSDFTCVQQCSTYGNTFTPWPESGVNDCNDIIETFSTDEQCWKSCAESPRCRNVEYDYDDGTCNQCFTSWFQLDPEQHSTNDPGWIMYTRNCE